MTDTTAGEGIPTPDGPSQIIDTDYEIGQDNMKKDMGALSFDIHNPVFLISGLVVVAFVILTLAFQEDVGPIFDGMRKWLTSNLAWFFLSAANVFVILCLVLIVTPLGNVRLGGK